MSFLAALDEADEMLRAAGLTWWSSFEALHDLLAPRFGHSLAVSLITSH